MPSNAYSGHFDSLLRDAEELNEAYTELQGDPALQSFATAALSRSVIVMCISAWESYTEELVRESLQALRSPAPHAGFDRALNELLQEKLQQFHTPSAANVRSLLRQTLGVDDIRKSWFWPNMTRERAASELGTALRLRHEIAHGVHPRPNVGNHYTSQLPDFFRRLGRRTDSAVRKRLVDEYGIAHPWPP